MSRLSPAQIDDVLARHDVAEVAQRLGSALRRSGSKWLGSCPLCGGGRTSARFEIRGQKWVCAVCCRGGNVIGLVQAACQLRFRAAIDWLGGSRLIDEREQESLRHKRAAQERVSAEQEAAQRERRRIRAYEIWRSGEALSRESAAGLMAEAYLIGRAIEPAHLEKASGARLALRVHDHLSFYHVGADHKQRILHKGPALLAAMIRPDGRFGAVHMTWIDPAQPGSKARIIDERGAIVSAKKMLGQKRSAHIALLGHAEPRRLFVGEGIETVLSVAVALAIAGDLRVDDAFWAAGDLGNLGGPARQVIAHPFLLNPRGLALHVPGFEPDLAQEALRIPDCVSELILLGDGDCDRFTAQACLQRAAKRHAKAGRLIRIAFAAEGTDYNDMLRQTRSNPIQIAEAA